MPEQERTPTSIKVTVRQKGGASTEHEVDHWSITDEGRLTLVPAGQGRDTFRQIIYPPTGYSRVDVDLTFPKEAV